MLLFIKINHCLGYVTHEIINLLCWLISSLFDLWIKFNRSLFHTTTFFSKDVWKEMYPHFLIVIVLQVCSQETYKWPSGSFVFSVLHFNNFLRKLQGEMKHQHLFGWSSLKILDELLITKGKPSRNHSKAFRGIDLYQSRWKCFHLEYMAIYW